MCMCVGMHAMVCTGRSETNSRDFLLTFAWVRREPRPSGVRSRRGHLYYRSISLAQKLRDTVPK